MKSVWVLRCLGIALAAPLAGAAQTQTPRPGQLPMLPLTQLDDRALAADLDNRTATFTFAQPIPVRDLLLQLIRGTSLSIVPDPSITESFIGELKNVTVRQALDLVLPQLGLGYSVDGAFITVFRREPETRLFDVNFIAAERTGESLVAATVPGTESSARVSTRTAASVFDDVSRGVQTLLSDRGVFNVDRKAGLLQVRDFPDRLDRVAAYLDAVHDRVHRQVEIDARVVEVELNDPTSQSLDWVRLAREAGFVAQTGPLGPPARGGRITDVPRFLAMLGGLGTVSVLANPRVLALNNEPVLVQAQGEDENVTLGLTPQIAADGIVTLSLGPVVRLRGATADQRAPARDVVRETDTLARVGSGETIVVSGFPREYDVRERRAGGWFGRSTVVTRKRAELLILLTPTIVGR